MPISIFRIVGAVSFAMAAGGPVWPADFPLAPGLSVCKPVVAGPEIICDWHHVDGPKVYKFYHDSLPKVGYNLLPGSNETTKPNYLGALGFRKGTSHGAVTISGTDLTIQIITH